MVTWIMIGCIIVLLVLYANAFDNLENTKKKLTMWHTIGYATASEAEQANRRTLLMDALMDDVADRRSRDSVMESIAGIASAAKVSLPETFVLHMLSDALYNAKSDETQQDRVEMLAGAEVHAAASLLQLTASYHGLRLVADALLVNANRTEKDAWIYAQVGKKKIPASFSKTQLGVKKLNKPDYISAMIEMASEYERTHRGMVNTYNEDVGLGIISAPPNSGNSVPTGRGVYKARLWAALFMVYAYSLSGRPQAEVKEMMNLATGVALDPLVSGKEPHLDRNEARSFTMDYLTPTVTAIVSAFEAGPMVPGQLREEHTILADQLHDALAESIGIDRYTADVRDRFADTIQGNAAMAMNRTMEWMAR